MLYASGAGVRLALEKYRCQGEATDQRDSLLNFIELCSAYLADIDRQKLPGFYELCMAYACNTLVDTPVGLYSPANIDDPAGQETRSILSDPMSADLDMKCVILISV